MPLFYQQDINGSTKLGVWLIREPENFFLARVPLQREITHPHKRLQHLAGRYLLKYLFPGFPYELIRIADTRKPYLQNAEYQFSISHCEDFAAAIVSRTERVGVDVEIATPRVLKIISKFLHEEEINMLENLEPGDPAFPVAERNFYLATLLWSVKESIFKWHGNGGVDFSEHIRLLHFRPSISGNIPAWYRNEMEAGLTAQYHLFGSLWLSWVNSG